MAAADLPANTKSGLIFYNTILSAALDGASTAQIWDAIKSHAANLGLPSPGISAADVSRIRGIVGAEVRGANLASNALPSDDPRSFAVTLPWSRGQAERNAAPQYLVRFAVDGLTDANGNQAFRSFLYGADNMPGSHADLLDSLAALNEAFDADYGTESNGVALSYGDGLPGLTIQAV